MLDFKKQYLLSEHWLKNIYVIAPYTTLCLPTISATKKCRLCNKVKFSSEFINCDLFVDRKLPTCAKCYRKRDNSKSVKIVNGYGFTKECSKCEETKLLGEFSHRKLYNDLYDICRGCNRNPLFDK